MPESAYRDELATVLQGDVLEVLPQLTDASVDSIVTDPPAGISFMGQDWDTFPTRRRPAGGQEYDPRGRAAFVAWLTAVMVECRRVLRPGGHALVWALPRTSHWTATAIEDAGFEIRDVVHHLFGQGFPKSLDVGRAVERAAGAEAAERWRGWGTALKPAAEHWILARRPLAGPSVAANALAHGTGALNIDGCRVPAPGGLSSGGRNTSSPNPMNRLAGRVEDRERSPEHPAGRWPANLALSHAEGCRAAGTRRVRGITGGTGNHDGVVYGARTNQGQAVRDYADADRMETVEAWECVEGCPVAELDRQSGERVVGRGGSSGRSALGLMNDDGWTPSTLPRQDYGDTGGASRFFYVAKASAADRSAGLAGDRNRHPTVKPVELMRWLCRLVTPPGGLVLDCFAGSGTTLVAAKLEGFRSIGIERDPESVRTCVRRLAWATHQDELLSQGGKGA